MSTGASRGTKYSKLLRINSSNRSSGTNSDFTIDYGANMSQVVGVSIDSIQFWNQIYNIYSTPLTSNNVFRVTVTPPAGSPTTVTVFWNPGYYSAVDFLTAFAEFCTGSLGFTLNWAIDQYTNLVSTSVAGGFTVVMSPALVSELGGRTQTEDPWNMLGFTYGSDGTFNLVDGHATYQPYMIHTSMAYLTSRILAPGNSFDEKGSVSNVLRPIAINSGWKELVMFECKDDPLCSIWYPRARALNQIDIQLVDHEGFNIDLGQSELNIELRIWYNNN